jgi:hypothetical protein
VRFSHRILPDVKTKEIETDLGLETGVFEDGFYRIVGGTAWSKTITVWLKASFLFWFQG